MREPIICIGENKAADQLCSNYTADQCLCFSCTDSTIVFPLKSEISSFYPASVTVHPGLCWTWSENPKTDFHPKQMTATACTEPRHGKTGLRGFRPGLTQTDMCIQEAA